MSSWASLHAPRRHGVSSPAVLQPCSCRRMSLRQQKITAASTVLAHFAPSDTGSGQGSVTSVGDAHEAHKIWADCDSEGQVNDLNSSSSSNFHSKQPQQAARRDFNQQLPQQAAQDIQAARLAVQNHYVYPNSDTSTSTISN